MNENKDILINFTSIEEIVIRATILISIILFCLFYIWSHIKGFKNKSQDRDKNAARKFAKNRKRKIKTKNSLDKEKGIS